MTKKFKKNFDEMIEDGTKIPLTESEALRLRGCGRATVQELIKMGLVTPSPPGKMELSVRALNCLNNAGIETKEQARQAIIEGRLKPDKKALNRNAPNKNRGIRNYGWTTHREVCKWAGLPEPMKKPKRVMICPHCGKNALSPSDQPKP